MERLFIGATSENDGKTTTVIGLLQTFKKRQKNVGFMKPVGQRYVQRDGKKIDADSVVVEEACGIDCHLEELEPIIMEKGYTEEYILRKEREDGSFLNGQLTRRVMRSFYKVSKDKDLILVEGTGHAGVGSVFDLSNAAVAKLLDCKVILISSGGIGRPIDKIMLNKALFYESGVELIGVIINKVDPKKYDKLNYITRLGLKQKGIDVFGVIPEYQNLQGSQIGRLVERYVEIDRLVNSLFETAPLATR